jgi:hypothetical protein
MDESAEMMLDSDDRITSGSHGEYQWLISTVHYVGTLIKRTPEVVLNRYLAVTSIDSGTPRLAEAQERAGWQLRKGVAYSPRLRDVEQLPDYQVHGEDAAGFDGWYIFTEPRDLGEASHGNVFTDLQPGRTLVFASYFDFVLDTVDAEQKELIDRFWKQLEWIQPESYIADCDKCLTFVTKNHGFFEIVHESLKKDYIEAQVAEPRK